MTNIRKIELLAPAKNADYGIEAINHGADAVYIGAPMFSARANAGNSIKDIERLVLHAHKYGARVYVAINTILTNEELSLAEGLFWDLYKIKCDAIIIQDFGLLQLNLPPIPIHASTQMDNRTVDKARFLEGAGFSQIVLARELSLSEIKNIHDSVKTPLEFFIHGALCVSYSGQCYLSQAITNRSANKGACAQLCRLPYILQDADGKIIGNNKHFLSMKDLNLSDNLEDLIDAGVSSLKIEGRLKDLAYVKNTVAFYRQKLDEILERRSEYKKASEGECKYTFTPNLDKSFNRGYTKYFINGKPSENWTLNSPKSTGEYVGEVSGFFDKGFTFSGMNLNNGDGLCFYNSKGELEGIHVNRVDGNNIFPAEAVNIKKRTKLYRNYSHEFEKIMLKNSSERKIDTDIIIAETQNGFSLSLTNKDDVYESLNFDYHKELAKNLQEENIIRNLSKTGNTIFKVNKVIINFSENWFIPASILSEWKRLAIDSLENKRISNHYIEKTIHNPTTHAFPVKDITYLGNVMNTKSKAFYEQHQSKVIEPAFEKSYIKGVPLMFTRHCIKQALGWCPKGKGRSPYKEPFFLIYNNTKIRLEFDCKVCEMRLLEE